MPVVAYLTVCLLLSVKGIQSCSDVPYCSAWKTLKGDHSVRCSRILYLFRKGLATFYVLLLPWEQQLGVELALPASYSAHIWSKLHQLEVTTLRD